MRSRSTQKGSPGTARNGFGFASLITSEDTRRDQNRFSRRSESARVLRDVREVPVLLVDVETVADDEAGRDPEPDVAQVEVDLLQPVLHEQRADLEGRGTARLQVLP